MMRLLIFTGIGSVAAIARKELIDRFNHIRSHRVSGKLQHYVIECAIHIVSCSQCFAFHPEDTEPIIIRKYRAGSQAVNIFRGQGNATDTQFLTVTVDNGNDGIARFELMCFGERLRNRDFRLIQFRHASVPEEQRVHCRFMLIGNGHQASDDRICKTFNFHPYFGDNTAFHFAHIRDRSETFRYPFRRTLKR